MPGDLLAGKEKVYEGYCGRRPDGWGRWHLVPGEGATAFAEHVVLTGVERQEVEQATRRVTGWGRHFNPERWLWRVYGNPDTITVGVSSKKNK